MKTASCAFALSLMLLLAACASTPSKEPIKTAPPPAPAAPQPKAPEAKPAPQQPVAVNPLKDPSNILSKRNVYFDFDQSIIKHEYQDLIKAHAQYLVAHPVAKVTLEGNCDERGSREYNLALGQRRAESVKQAMSVLGAAANRIETLSYGKEKPVCSEHEESCWWKNRRTETVYVGEK